MQRMLFALLLCPSFALAATIIGWVPPTTNTDGSALVDLKGYKILWGPTSSVSNLTVVDVPDPSATRKSVDIPPGTWYVRMKAYTASTESVLTTATAVTVAGDPVPTCGASPAPESRQQTCTAPTIGSWTQSRTYTSAPAPACWTAGPWVPSEAAAGACAQPPPLTTSGSLSYQERPTGMVAIGLVAAGLTCGPDTKTVASVKYCRITRAQTDLINWPSDLGLTTIWARAK